MTDADVLVMGGGLVGSAIAYGLVRTGHRVLVLDEGDVALRASRGNFGLVWVQGKGLGMPAYADLARLSSELWPSLASELETRTGIDVHYRRRGGFHACLGEEELARRSVFIGKLREQQGTKGYECEIVDRKRLDNLLPSLGTDVVGATYCPHDGHVSPLRLLKALHAAIGESYRPIGRVTTIDPVNGGFRVKAGDVTLEARQIILAAGLGNLALCRMLGFALPVRPQRGQILVTERLSPFIDYPMSGVRQTDEGSVMLGSSQEETGYDDGTTPKVMQAIAHRALKVFPRLTNARLIRAWGALRILAPDEFPIYQRIPGHDGAVVATCHSGVSLAGAHALKLAPDLILARLPDHLTPFHSRRFDGARSA